MSSPKLLLNAEPFGFGPTAAIASIFPHLRDHFDTLSYVGKHHTLDLQYNLPYDHVHDVSEMGKEEREDTLLPIFSEYDVFLSAMDHKMVEIAQKAGLSVFYYDALAWYWKDIPDSVKKSDLYIAQDFFGVEQRLNEIFGEAASQNNIARVAPIVSVPKAAKAKKYTLINLGGLQNPYTPLEDLTDFARHVIDGLRAVIPDNQEIIIACSKAIVERLNDPHVKTYDRAEMEDILAQSSTAFMTPGLGNIYDAAAYDIPTVWLPPANDSQGQQLRLLAQHKMMDGALDWHHFTDIAPIDYKKEQIDVLEQISKLAQNFALEASDHVAFRNAASMAYRDLKANSQCGALIKKFGTGGEKEIANLVINKAKEASSQRRLR
jgi:hypothetical protein